MKNGQVSHVARVRSKSLACSDGRRAGCHVIRSEKRSGGSTQDRDELKTILDFIHSGDKLVVTRIDRLARSIGDLQDIVRTLRAKGASLKATEQPIDTSTAAGKAFLDMLGVFAEFETSLRRSIRPLRPHLSLGNLHRRSRRLLALINKSST